MNLQALVSYISELSIYEFKNIMHYLLVIGIALLALTYIALCVLNRERKIVNVYNPNFDGSKAVIWHKQYASETTFDKVIDFIFQCLFNIFVVGLLIVTILSVLALGYFFLVLA